MVERPPVSVLLPGVGRAQRDSSTDLPEYVSKERRRDDRTHSNAPARFAGRTARARILGSDESRGQRNVGRRRAEATLTPVVAMCYLLSASTRQMEKFVQYTGITRLSQFQDTGMAKELVEHVQVFRTRPLDVARTRSSPPTPWF